MRETFWRTMRQISSNGARGVTNKRSYEDAVRTLNGLQSNSAVLAHIRLQRDKRNEDNIPDFLRFSNRAGLTVEDLDRLSVIHVSGTKGKGSTCAFCESILRAHGFKTGFYSSPHLLEVRERIRINGRPLAKQDFSDYFWQCYDPLYNSKADYGDEMPAYFRFMTIMAFQVFLQEKVDVAIVEVGIGGQYDCTNAIRKPVVCGISSLGYDHMSILGNTLDQIAWHKAGILKAGSVAVTVPQPENSLKFILQRSAEKQCPVQVAPPIEQYDWGEQAIELGLQGSVQKVNASLAMQLSHIWMKKNGSQKSENGRNSDADPAVKVTASTSSICDQSEPKDSEVEMAPVFPVTQLFAKGLKRCCWPGRNQVIQRDLVTYFLDGAHTPRSIQQCIEWYKGQTQDTSDDGLVKILLFNATGDRKPETLLKPLADCGFDMALFCPNIAYKSSNNADQMNYMVTPDSQCARCVENRSVWKHLISTSQLPDPTGLNEVKGSSSPAKKQKMSDKSDFILKNNGGQGDMHNAISPAVNGSPADNGEQSPNNGKDIQQSNWAIAHIFDCVNDALEYIGQGHDPDKCNEVAKLRSVSRVHVLVTGSLHLVGCTLKVLDPNLNESF